MARGNERTSREAQYDERREPQRERERVSRARSQGGVSQRIYERQVLPGQVEAVEEQIGAMKRASSMEEAAASARARDISRGLKGTAPGGFEDTLRGSITQEAGTALGYESALRGAKAQQEVQDPSRMAPIVAQREKELIKLEEEIADQETAGSAIATVSATAGGVMLAGATIASLGPAAGPGAPIVAVIGAVVAIVGAIAGLAASGEARPSRRGAIKEAKDKYDPSKVREVNFATALGSSQRGARGYLGGQFTGGTATGAGVESRISNFGGKAPKAEEAAPWTQFTGVS